jgi:hypothetical protein
VLHSRRLRPAGDDGNVVTVHLEGNFPGGVIDLQQKFMIRDRLISGLVIEA